ncbi:terminase small subunit [Xylella fastidiosa]|uniref:terminase small subunit n=1 Tax=Xylella fastidiosa TaxID=2371 RepID=UPI00234D951C
MTAAEEAAGGAVADIEEWKRRKIAAEAQREELHLADAKSRLLLWSRWKDIGRVFAEVRANLRTIPGRTVALLLGETDERRYKRVLLQENRSDLRKSRVLRPDPRRHGPRRRRGNRRCLKP